MDAALMAQTVDILKRMGKSGDPAGTATLFAYLARIAGYTDTLETLLGLTSEAASSSGDVLQRLAQLILFTDTLEATLGANTDAAATNASIWAMLKTINNKPSAPASAIKSVQRGSASIASASSSVNVTISSVDMTKTMVIITSTSGSAGAGDACVTGYLLNATTLSLTRGGSGSISADIKWQVIEFN